MNIYTKYFVILIISFLFNCVIAMDQLSTGSFASCDSFSRELAVIFFGEKVSEDHPLLELDCVAKGIFSNGIPQEGFDFETEFFPLYSAKQEGLDLSENEAQDFLNHLICVQKQEPISFLRNDFEHKARLFFFAEYLCMRKHPLFLKYLKEMLSFRSYIPGHSLSFKMGGDTIYVQNYIKDFLQKPLATLVKKYANTYSVNQVEGVPEEYIESTAKKSRFLVSSHTHYTDRLCARRYEKIDKKIPSKLRKAIKEYEDLTVYIATPIWYDSFFSCMYVLYAQKDGVFDDIDSLFHIVLVWDCKEKQLIEYKFYVPCLENVTRYDQEYTISLLADKKSIFIQEQYRADYNGVVCSYVYNTQTKQKKNLPSNLSLQISPCRKYIICQEQTGFLSLGTPIIHLIDAQTGSDIYTQSRSYFQQAYFFYAIDEQLLKRDCFGTADECYVALYFDSNKDPEEYIYIFQNRLENKKSSELVELYCQSIDDK